LLKSVASASEKEYEQIQKDVEAFEKELDSERYFSLLVIQSSLDPEQIFKLLFTKLGLVCLYNFNSNDVPRASISLCKLRGINNNLGAQEPL